jgi:aryl sulfotransferase
MKDAAVGSEETEIVLPRKTREMHNHTLDSTRWNDFVFREGDIVVGTWAKTGTTWLQHILFQLLEPDMEFMPSFDLVPWVEQRYVPKQRMLRALAARARRRLLKTHLPIDCLVFSPKARYIYLARDGRDVVWSWYNHHKNLTPVVYEVINGTPGRQGPPLYPPTEDIRQFFHDWLDKDGFPLWPFWSHVQSWWDVRRLPNVLLTHFNRLKTDIAAEIRRLAAFLEIDIDLAAWPRILEHCSFEHMQRNAATLSRTFDVAFVGGGQTFIHRGTNGRWRSILTESDIQKYEDAARRHLTPDCAHWLATGTSGFSE